MIRSMQKNQSRRVGKLISLFVCFTFTFSLIIPPQAQAQSTPVLNLPAPGTMIHTSPGFIPPIIRGITIHPDNPLKFDFLVDKGDDPLNFKELKDESRKLIKYFLATLTIPEKDLWVNLSPYEKDRIIPQEFGQTEMGRDLLAQDYILKQLTASLIYPEDDLGKKFWDKVHKQAYERFGVTDIPVDTFNKVWIVPERAVVYERGNTAFIADSYLKVMLEEDYLALSESTKDEGRGMRDEESSVVQAKRSSIVHRKMTSTIIREIILPEIEREVNEGKNFAQLRQIYNSMILATWFKRKLMVGAGLDRPLLGQVYVDQNKVKGVDVADKQIKQKIYEQYLAAYKKGVYNYIKEDYDPTTKQMIPRKYFSGGVGLFDMSMMTTVTTIPPTAVAYTQTVLGRGDNVIALETEVLGISKKTDLAQIAASNDQFLSDKAMLGREATRRKFLLSGVSAIAGGAIGFGGAARLSRLRSGVKGEEETEETPEPAQPTELPASVQEAVRSYRIITSRLEQREITIDAQDLPILVEAARYPGKDPISVAQMTESMFIPPYGLYLAPLVLEALQPGQSFAKIDEAQKELDASGNLSVPREYIVPIIHFLIRAVSQSGDSLESVAIAHKLLRKNFAGASITPVTAAKLIEIASREGKNLTEHQLRFHLDMADTSARLTRPVTEVESSYRNIYSVLTQNRNDLVNEESTVILIEASRRPGQNEARIIAALTTVKEGLGLDHVPAARLVLESVQLGQTLEKVMREYRVAVAATKGKVLEGPSHQNAAVLLIEAARHAQHHTVQDMIAFYKKVRDDFRGRFNRSMIPKFTAARLIAIAFSPMPEAPYLEDPSDANIATPSTDAAMTGKKLLRFPDIFKRREINEPPVEDLPAVEVEALEDIKMGDGGGNEHIIREGDIPGGVPSLSNLGGFTDGAMVAVWPRVNPAATVPWRKLQYLTNTGNLDLRELFSDDPERAKRLTVAFDDEFAVDFSKNLINKEVIETLLQLADQVKLKQAIEQMFNGEKINETEGRAVLHTALRNVTRDASGAIVAANGPVYVDGKDVMPGVIKVLNQMKEFTEKVRSGQWKGATGKSIKHIVNIGIGGSDLGPKMDAEALKPFGNPSGIKVHFVSNVDGTAAAELIRELGDPEEILVIIESKSFTTQETIQNAMTLKKWVSDYYAQIEGVSPEEAIKKHFVAVSTAKDLVEAFGIDTDNMFEFWDWVGGRYSMWSAIGLTLATFIGFDNFFEMLEGAREVDEHFRNQPFDQNIPVLKALFAVWNRNFLNAQTAAILPYDEYLALLPDFLQQGFMESLGKGTDRSGNFITDYDTGQVIWGAAGTNGQHAFYQKMHQAPFIIPADFIGIARSQNPLPGHHDKLYANFLAQPYALAFGARLEEVMAALDDGEISRDELKWLAAHRTFPGNKPTTSIFIDEMTPRALGKLVAMYEHQIMAEGVIYNIFPFDQWGVELGKVVATKHVLGFLDGSRPLAELAEVPYGHTIRDAVERFVEKQPQADAAMMVQEEYLSNRELEERVEFKTAGWRGLLKTPAFSLNQVGRFAAAVAEELKDWNGEQKVLVAYDARETSPEFAKKIVEVLSAYGIKADLGTSIVHTPAVTALTREALRDQAYSLGIHITASHNDNSWQGVKTLLEGSVNPDVLSRGIAARANKMTDYQRVPFDEIPNVSRIDIVRITQERYQSSFPGLVEGLRAYQRENPGAEFIVDMMHGSASVFSEYFRTLGAKVIRTTPMAKNTFPQELFDEKGKVDKVPYRPEPKEEFLDQEAFENFKTSAVDGSVYWAIDGDGDRVVAWIKRNGKTVELMANELGPLYAWYLLKNRLTPWATILYKSRPTTYGMDAVVEWANKNPNVQNLELRIGGIGSKYFKPYMRDNTRKVGISATEESGHHAVRIGDEVFFDDAIAQVLFMMTMMGNTKKNLGELVEVMQSEINFKGVFRRVNPMLTDELKAGITEPLQRDPREFAEKVIGQVKENLPGLVVERISLTVKSGEGGLEREIVTLEQYERDPTQFELDANEGVHIQFKDGPWIMIRLSGTENVGRIYTEAQAEQVRQTLENASLSAIGLGDHTRPTDPARHPSDGEASASQRDDRAMAGEMRQAALKIIEHEEDLNKLREIIESEKTDSIVRAAAQRKIKELKEAAGQNQDPATMSLRERIDQYPVNEKDRWEMELRGNLQELLRQQKERRKSSSAARRIAESIVEVQGELLNYLQMQNDETPADSISMERIIRGETNIAILKKIADSREFPFSVQTLARNRIRELEGTQDPDKDQAMAGESASERARDLLKTEWQKVTEDALPETTSIRGKDIVIVWEGLVTPDMKKVLAELKKIVRKMAKNLGAKVFDNSLRERVSTLINETNPQPVITLGVSPKKEGKEALEDLQFQVLEWVYNNIIKEKDDEEGHFVILDSPVDKSDPREMALREDLEEARLISTVSTGISSDIMGTAPISREAVVRAIQEATENLNDYLRIKKQKGWQKRILVVHNNRKFREEIARILGLDPAYRVQALTQGEARGILRDNLSAPGTTPIDLVIVDYDARPWSGELLAQNLRSEFPDRPLPVMLMMTSQEDDILSDQRIINETGAKGVVRTTEFRPGTFGAADVIDALMAQVEKVLDEYRAKRAAGDLAMAGEEDVLVVSDDNRIREPLARSLREKGFTVSSETDIADALRSQGARPYDVVIVDIDKETPGSRELELVSELQKKSPGTKVVVIMGGLRPEDFSDPGNNLKALSTSMSTEYMADRVVEFLGGDAAMAGEEGKEYRSISAMADAVIEKSQRLDRLIQLKYSLQALLGTGSINTPIEGELNVKLLELDGDNEELKEQMVSILEELIRDEQFKQYQLSLNLNRSQEEKVSIVLVLGSAGRSTTLADFIYQALRWTDQQYEATFSNLPAGVNEDELDDLQHYLELRKILPTIDLSAESPEDRKASLKLIIFAPEIIMAWGRSHYIDASELEERRLARFAGDDQPEEQMTLDRGRELLAGLPEKAEQAAEAGIIYKDLDEFTDHLVEIGEALFRIRAIAEAAWAIQDSAMAGKEESARTVIVTEKIQAGDLSGAVDVDGNAIDLGGIQRIEFVSRANNMPMSFSISDETRGPVKRFSDLLSRSTKVGVPELILRLGDEIQVVVDAAMTGEDIERAVASIRRSTNYDELSQMATSDEIDPRLKAAAQQRRQEWLAIAIKAKENLRRRRAMEEGRVIRKVRGVDNAMVVGDTVGSDAFLNNGKVGAPTHSDVPSQWRRGGIDLNAAHLDLQIKRDGNGVPLPLNLQPLETMNIEGFVPIIINIKPVMNLPLLLGLGPDSIPTPAVQHKEQQKARELELTSL